MIINKEIKAVIIGLGRQGNTKEAISKIMGIKVNEIEKIIKDYTKNTEKTPN